MLPHCRPCQTWMYVQFACRPHQSRVLIPGEAKEGAIVILFPVWAPLSYCFQRSLAQHPSQDTCT